MQFSNGDFDDSIVAQNITEDEKQTLPCKYGAYFTDVAIGIYVSPAFQSLHASSNLRSCGIVPHNTAATHHHFSPFLFIYS